MTEEQRQEKIHRLLMLKLVAESEILPSNAILWFEQPYKSTEDVFSVATQTAKQYPHLANKKFTLDQLAELKVRHVVCPFPSSLIDPQIW